MEKYPYNDGESAEGRTKGRVVGQCYHMANMYRGQQDVV